MIKKILFLIVCLVVLHPNQINAQTYTVVLQPGSTGGEWRWDANGHQPDFIPHWDYKAFGKNMPWQNIYPH